MAKKKPNSTPAVEYVTVKIAKPEHARLRTVSGETGLDMAEILSDLVHAPLEKAWKASVARLNKQAEGSS